MIKYELYRYGRKDPRFILELSLNVDKIEDSGEMKLKGDPASITALKVKLNDMNLYSNAGKPIVFPNMIGYLLPNMVGKLSPTFTYRLITGQEILNQNYTKPDLGSDVQD